MALKWQEIPKAAIAGGGTLSLAVLLTLIFSLAGISYSDSGDVACTDCYSEIQVNSTYWEVCAEHAGPDEDIMWKKTTRGRRLWVNLDKIDEMIITEPSMRVDMLVPTTKRYAEYDHPEYGYLRNIKDGDCFIKRRTIANDRPSRIILHGQKSAFDTVKWSFILNDAEIDIDPLWLPVSKKVEALYECRNQSTIEEVTGWEVVNETRLVGQLGTCQRNTSPYSCLNTSGPDTDCANRTQILNFTCYTSYENQTVQKNVSRIEEQTSYELIDCTILGYRIKNRELDFRDKQYYCSLDNRSESNPVLICDSKIDGNGDGICQSGESCSIVDVNNLKVEYNYDNAMQQKIITAPEGSVATTDFEKVIKRK